MAVKNPKFFRIATEGATSDGRVIDRQMIVQMAATYDPQTYGARINMEHIRGYDPTGLFKAYGDVLALKAEEQDGKMRLFAQLDPTAELVAFNKARQKVFCSMEVNPDFADTGEAYLTGLAVTDNPASLGCEMLAFSAKAKVNPLAERKQDPQNLFTEAVEITLDFSEEKPEAKGKDSSSLSASIKRIFSRQDKTDADNEAKHADTNEAVTALAAEVKGMNDNFSKVLKAVETVAERVDKIQEDQSTANKEFSTLKGELENTETYSRRPPATGGDSNTTIKTDC
ncbi:GPO family capsid scaffolding protein [Cupriavidus metallidurans]|uniref:GPO family capsid scaffolding protein n=1 Tax=Cupriavidus metallidurans TaxID=119219 RepID=UPI001CCD4461|nr:GPO family capsid scaffolding protein [Cupriavidus metallidurans]UBM12563.1 GPO family capsid scaffolding protein [Cupriavidus metallidurans]